MKPFFKFFLILSITIPVFGQTEANANLSNDEIKELTSKLSMKLLLNENQTSELNKLLLSYKTELDKMNSVTGISDEERQKLTAEINKQIESLLDKKQKMKFDVVSNEWWSAVKEEESD